MRVPAPVSHERCLADAAWLRKELTARTTTAEELEAQLMELSGRNRRLADTQREARWHAADVERRNLVLVQQLDARTAEVAELKRQIGRQKCAREERALQIAHRKLGVIELVMDLARDSLVDEVGSLREHHAELRSWMAACDRRNAELRNERDALLDRQARLVSEVTKLQVQLLALGDFEAACLASVRLRSLRRLLTRL